MEFSKIASSLFRIPTKGNPSEFSFCRINFSKRTYRVSVKNEFSFIDQYEILKQIFDEPTICIKMTMKDFLVFDLETQRSASDVGGWNNIPEMKVSVGVVWDSRTQKFHTYYEKEVKELITHLKSGPTVIGYNHMGFDYAVLSGYYQAGPERDTALKAFKALDNLDLLVMIKDVLGKRVKLDQVARPTLDVGKSADGLLALKWYKEYLEGDNTKLKMIADYCVQDVAVTRDVYLYGLEHNELLYIDKQSGIQKMKINWYPDTSELKEDEEPEQLSF